MESEQVHEIFSGALRVGVYSAFIKNPLRVGLAYFRDWGRYYELQMWTLGKGNSLYLVCENPYERKFGLYKEKSDHLDGLKFSKRIGRASIKDEFKDFFFQRQNFTCPFFPNLKRRFVHMKKPLLGTSKLAPYLFVIGLISVVALIPALAHADVDGSLRNIQGALVNRILPVMGMIGLALAGLSYFSGNPSAHGHLKLALIGAVVGFLGPAIIEFIRGLVQ